MDIGYWRLDIGCWILDIAVLDDEMWKGGGNPIDDESENWETICSRHAARFKEVDCVIEPSNNDEP